MSASIQFKIEELFKRQRSAVSFRLDKTETRFENGMCSTVVYWEFQTASMDPVGQLSGLDEMLKLEYPGLKIITEVMPKEVAGYKLARTIVTVRFIPNVDLPGIIEKMVELTVDIPKLGWGTWQEVAIEWFEGDQPVSYFAGRYEISGNFIRTVFERWRQFEKYRGQ